jgi:hypothetical protein
MHSRCKAHAEDVESASSQMMSAVLWLAGRLIAPNEAQKVFIHPAIHKGARMDCSNVVFVRLL